jgi:hypothetical protein
MSMNPQQDYLGPHQNPYDFIMNPGKPPKKRLGLDPFVTKIFLGLGVLFGLMVLIAVFLSLTASKSTSTADLVALAQTQQEIIRVANQGSVGAVQQVTKNLAITTEFTLKTQQADLLDYLGKQGREVKDAELDLKQNATTDLDLKDAKETSTFDITFSQILEEELRNYANTANRLFNNTANEKQQTFLSKYYSEAQDLITQVPFTRDDIEDAE